MLRGVAEPGRQRQRAFQIEPGVVFVGEADRAMDLDRFARYAQEVVVLKDGRVIALRRVPDAPASNSATALFSTAVVS